MLYGRSPAALAEFQGSEAVDVVESAVDGQITALLPRFRLAGHVAAAVAA